MLSVETRNLEYRYGSGHRALKGVNLSLQGNDPVAIIGQNGAGKTTLVKHFNGILRPTSGNVLINGVDVNECSTARWAGTVGYVFQNPDDQLFLETVRKELEFGPLQMGLDERVIADRLERVSGLVGLDDKLDVHPFDLTATEKKFCTIGAVLMMEPGIVVFDEPTCGQDMAGNRRLEQIIKTLARQNRLCITISHDMKFVTRNFRRVVVMNQGNVLVDGDVDEVFSQPDVLRRSFVAPPPITKVGRAAGLKETVFTVEGLMDAVKRQKESEV